jgi:hypothetical protein
MGAGGGGEGCNVVAVGSGGSGIKRNYCIDLCAACA